MKITKHAKGRINDGDHLGLRTILSTNEIIRHVNSELSVKVGQEVFFFSEKDDCCLCAIVANKGKTLVTVKPSTRYSQWMPFITEFRARGSDAFVEGKSPKKFTPLKVAIVSLGLYNSKKQSLKVIQELFVWFDFEASSNLNFRTREFHVAVQENVNALLKELDWSKNKIRATRIKVRGKNWSFQFPIWVSYEVLDQLHP